MMSLLNHSPFGDVPPHPLPPSTNGINNVPLKCKHFASVVGPHQDVGAMHQLSSTAGSSSGDINQYQQLQPVYSHPHQQHQSSLNEDDGSSELMFCVCGLTHDGGFSIACDDCGRWGHASCFGIIWGKFPDNWSCGQCTPALDDISLEPICCVCGLTHDNGFSIACDDCGRWGQATSFDIVWEEVPDNLSCRQCTPALNDDSFEPTSCICGLPYDDGSSVTCDNCGRWCHAACIGIARWEVPDNWSCRQCVTIQNPLQLGQEPGMFYEAVYEHSEQGKITEPGIRRSSSPPAATWACGHDAVLPIDSPPPPPIASEEAGDDRLPQLMTDVERGHHLNDHRERVKLIITRLTNVFRNVQQYRQLLKYQGTEAQTILDVFQMLLNTPGLLPEFKSNLLVAMQRLSKKAGLYPASYDLRNVRLENDEPVAAGSFADIYKGHFDGKVVCLKVLRLYQTSQADAFLKQFCMEAILWSQLSHPNLLPVYGLYRYGVRVSLVSPWMEYGDITAFLYRFPDECRTLLVIDVASGINYLHTHGIIHGDLKGANILIDSSRRARLADFGLSGVSENNILNWTSHSSAASKGGSVRWQAPELFDFESETIIHNSKFSDMYAFACVAYEVYTGAVPFYDIPRDAAVIHKVQSGHRPSRPDPSSHVWDSRRLTEGIWVLMETCWAKNPQTRPSIKDAYGVLVGEGRAAGDDRPTVDIDVMSPGHLRDCMDVREELSANIEAVLDQLKSS